MSRGPYMKRPITICAPSSVNTVSFTRWLAVTFWGTNDKTGTETSGNISECELPDVNAKNTDPTLILT